MKLKSLFEELKNTKSQVLVVGLGVTGIETALFLRRHNIGAVCVESATKEEYEKNSKYVERCNALRKANVDLHFGIDAVKIKKLLKNIGLCVLSPGVPLSHPIVLELQRKKIPITGEFELGIELSELPCVAVTGSNGKSTVVSLIDAILKESGRSSLLCGNIGEPVVSQISETLISKSSGIDSDKFLVAEASSYQLESCESLKPKVGVFLNLSNNHLERHGSMEAYFEAKKNLFIRQDASDFAIVNIDDMYGERLLGALRAKIVVFGFRKQALKHDSALIEYDAVNRIDRIRLSLEGREETYECARSNLSGRHTRYNIAAAIAATRCLGVAKETIQSVIDSFCPLEHRIEKVAEKNSVLYINDSKSTTVASSCVALETVLEYFPPRYVVLLIGGQAKKASWESLLTLLKEHEKRLRAVICFGKDGGMLKRELKRVKIDAVECPKLADSVRLATDAARHNDVVLLSPGCASFDEFKDFEERGNAFKSLVDKL